MLKSNEQSLSHEFNLEKHSDFSEAINDIVEKVSKVGKMQICGIPLYIRIGFTPFSYDFKAVFTPFSDF